MPETSNSLPELPFFTNRFDERDLFTRHLNTLESAPDAPKTALPLLMFYGIGGCGKSYLRSYLRRELAQLRLTTPVVELDFNPSNVSSVNPGSREETLLAIRVFLGVPCPNFDKAMAIYLSRQDASSSSGPLNPRMENYGEVGGDLAESFFSFVPGAGFLFKKGVQRLAQWDADNDKDFKRLNRLDTGTLYQSLMLELQADLNKNLPAQRDRQPLRCRAVIFLDSFEFFAGLTETSTEQGSAERWVCDLAAGLPQVLFVLSGRSRLQWQCDGALSLVQTELHGFTEEYARQYLTLRGITSRFEPLQDAILATCDIRNEPGYHPLSLQICAATALRIKENTGHFPAAADFQMAPGDLDELVNRFLLALDADEQEALKRLCVTLRYDGEAGEAGCGGNSTIWDYISTLSLLPDTQSGWQIMHDLVRRSLLKSNSRDLKNGARRRQQRHNFWIAHWKSRSQSPTDEFAGLAWYHQWHLDPEAALNQWKEQAKDARKNLRMAEHLALLCWWDTTEIKTHDPRDEIEAMALNILGIELSQASLGNRTLQLRAALNCYKLARIIFEPGSRNWALTQIKRGDALTDLPDGDRAQNLRDAIACYDLALTVYESGTQEWSITQNSKGLALIDLALTCLMITDTELPDGDYAQNLRDAVTCFDAALTVRKEDTFLQDWAKTQNNKGNALQKLPDGDRAQNLRKAIACYDLALTVYKPNTFPQERASIQNNKGLALDDLALLDLSEDDRIQNRRDAIACYNDALTVCSSDKFPQLWATTHLNKSIALANLENFPEAFSCIEVAIEEYRKIGHDFLLQSSEEVREWIGSLSKEQNQPPDA